MQHLGAEELDALAGEPDIIRRAVEHAGKGLPAACPGCGGNELLAEPALDEDGMPTGLLVVSCDACGREIGQVEAPPPALEAEPERDEGSLLPGPSELPRV
jgi:hypothetical protein